MDVVEVPDDLFGGFAIEQPRPRVYYETGSGFIRGVSFVSDDAQGDTPFIFVSQDEALKLINGEYMMDDWIVDHWAPEPHLIRLSDYKVELDLVERLPVAKLVGDETLVHPLTMKIMVSRQGGYLGFQFYAPSKHLRVELLSEANLKFIVTRRNNPQALVGTFQLSARHLSLREPITLRMPRDAGEEIDIYTERCVALNYVIEIVDRVRPILPLPYGFEDMRLSRKGMPTHPALTIDRDQDDLVLSLHGGGGAIYDRRLAFLGVALCAPGDPQHPYAFMRVPISVLEEGSARAAIPSNLVATKFDICTQLLYHSVYDVRSPTD